MEERIDNSTDNSTDSNTDNSAGKDLVALTDERFHLPVQDWSQYGPLTLAYIGDGVYDLIIRTILVKRSDTQADRLHRMKSQIVKAGAQADLMRHLLPRLTEQEHAIYRRGRNSKPANTAKNAGRQEYLEATGFEALVGYLYLDGQYGRLIGLLQSALEESGQLEA